MRPNIASLVFSTYACLVASVVDNAMASTACVKTMTHTVFITDGFDTGRSAASTQIWTMSSPSAASSSVQSQGGGTIGAAPCRSPMMEPSATAALVPSGEGYMAVVDRWRARMGLEALSCSAKLEANAMDTVMSSNGEMIHKLNPGTFGQVLAPDPTGDFEHVFVGGWLCEIPSLPGLQGVCVTQSDGWAYNGQTGHAEILVSANYSGIGCALYAGIWCCDLA